MCWCLNSVTECSYFEMLNGWWCCLVGGLADMSQPWFTNWWRSVNLFLVYRCIHNCVSEKQPAVVRIWFHGCLCHLNCDLPWRAMLLGRSTSQACPARMTGPMHSSWKVDPWLGDGCTYMLSVFSSLVQQREHLRWLVWFSSRCVALRTFMVQLCSLIVVSIERHMGHIYNLQQDNTCIYTNIINESAHYRLVNLGICTSVSIDSCAWCWPYAKSMLKSSSHIRSCSCKAEGW